MGLDLVGDQVIVVKNNAARIVGEDGDADIARAALFPDFLRRAFDIMAVEALFNTINRRGENGVFAVFRPCLGDGFQLDVLGRAPFGFEIITDSLDIKEGQAKRAAARAVWIFNPGAPDFFEFTGRNV